MDINKTTYILHGGFRPGITANNDFFRGILSYVTKRANVLLVMYAKPQEKWEHNVAEIQNEFLNNADGCKLEFQVASKEDMEQQLLWADIVYFHGGSTELIIKNLGAPFVWKNLLLGKIVVGDSAGGNYLATWGYSMLLDRFFSGSGVLPIIFIPHFDPTKTYELPKSPDLQVLKLKEFEFLKYSPNR